MSTTRGCPPRGPCLAGGISGSTMAHCSSVRSEGYFFRGRSFLNMATHSCVDRICANYLINLLFCQAMFPDSLSETTRPHHVCHHRMTTGSPITRFCRRVALTWDTARAVATDQYLPGQTSAA